MSHFSFLSFYFCVSISDVTFSVFLSIDLSPFTFVEFLEGGFLDRVALLKFKVFLLLGTPSPSRSLVPVFNCCPGLAWKLLLPAKIKRKWSKFYSIIIIKGIRNFTEQNWDNKTFNSCRYIEAIMAWQNLYARLIFSWIYKISGLNPFYDVMLSYFYFYVNLNNHAESESSEPFWAVELKEVLLKTTG